LSESQSRHPGLSDLVSWAASNGLILSPAQQRQLSVHLETLLLWNRRIDLVSQSDPGVIVAKHFADSLLPSRFCPEDARIADLGSGAGFPGLVLAVALPGAFVSVIESRAKRTSFLAEVVRLATIENVDVIQARAESLADQADHRHAYDVVISRALGPLRDFLPLARPLLRAGGIALAMKGPRYADEIDALGEQPYARELTHPYRLPDGSERVLLGFRCA
jgi:16S rRNA (guanine527-N7)-methyltransferase